MGTVCSATLLGSLVDLDVLDDQISGIKAFDVRVCFSVFQQAEQELGRLDGPSCARDTELLSCNIIQSAFAFQVPEAKIRMSSYRFVIEWRVNIPCAARPVPPAYLLIATASLCS